MVHRSRAWYPFPPVLAGALSLATALAGVARPSGLAAQSPTTPRSGEDQARVLAVVEAFNEAFADNDPDRYFTFIDSEITVFTASNPYRVDGIRDDRREFEWSLESGRTRVGYFQELQPRVQVFGDVAVVTYHSRGAYGPDGTTAYLKETDVLVRRDGEWKIVHIHVSSTSP